MMDVENNVENVENAIAGSQNEKTINYEELYKQTSKTLLELTAERDSLKNENDELRKSHADMMADVVKTREMNYTLSRQLDLGQQAHKQPEDILADMFLKKGE